MYGTPNELHGDKSSHPAETSNSKERGRFSLAHFVPSSASALTIFTISAVVFLFLWNGSISTSKSNDSISTAFTSSSSSSSSSSASSSSSLSSSSATAATAASGGSWTINKHTQSIASGSLSSVQTFISKYITDASTTSDLGCESTKKLVGTTVNFELHWVDSNVFEQAGLSIREWSEYIEASSGTTPMQFNSFHHHKVQLFVPSLAPHLLTLTKGGDSIGAGLMYRTSTSTPLGTEGTPTSSNDVSHISILVPNTTTVYEIVGPSDSLSYKELLQFSPWDETTECAGAHSLPYSLSYYKDLYSNLLSSQAPSASTSLWETGTGMPTPMVVSISLPTDSITYISDTINIIRTIAGTSVATSSIQWTSQCRAITLDFSTTDGSSGSTSGTFTPIISYIQNTYSSGTEGGVVVEGEEGEEEEAEVLTVFDLEHQIQRSHDSMRLQSHLSLYSSWDRYLDSHTKIKWQPKVVGSETGYAPTSVCAAMKASLLSVLESSDQQPIHADRYEDSDEDSDGIHYYTGVRGLHALDFNLPCANDDDFAGLCGCNSLNNLLAYNGGSCTPS